MDLRLDNTGFPMVWFQSIGAFVQWLPITKIQVEYFLTETNDAIFDERWYGDVDRYNPRISPTQIRKNNYWQTLSTGIKPREALRYTMWCGRGYSLPEADEWQSIYQEANSIAHDPALLNQIINLDDLRERPRTLLQRLNSVMPDDTASGKTRTLADAMMLRMGIMEYVFEDANRNTFVGLGLTNPDFVGSFRRAEDPQHLNNPSEGQRMRDYGFRLIYRGA